MTVDFLNNLENSMEFLHKKGAFLTVKNGDKVNTMVISWGSVGFAWQRPVFTILVRNTRYTYELLQNSSEFTVSIPMGDHLKDAMAICGSESGRDINKFEKANLAIKGGKSIDTPVIADCKMFYECNIIFKQEMDQAMMSNEVKAFYKNDYHTLYYGEIVDCYME